MVPRRSKVLLSLFLTVGMLAALVVVAPPAFAATIAVNSTADNQADDGVCTLREAIVAANMDTASGGTMGECAAGSGADTIEFDIPGDGPHTIAPASALPSITAPVTIDGYTETGASANSAAVGTNAVIMIEIDGSGAGAGVSGLFIAATGGGSAIRGIGVTNFTNTGIFLNGSGNTVEGNFVGMEPDGTTAAGNNINGIALSSSSNNTVGGTTSAARNLISGNVTGIRLAVSSNANTIAGNLIGTDAAGDIDRGNSSVGIIVDGTPEDNTIGGASGGARNVISGNNFGGVLLNGSGVMGNEILGNLIGTNAAGDAPLANGTSGVRISGAPNNSVGGDTPGAGNVISGNGADGVLIEGAGASGNEVQGNFIGTNAPGNGPLGNDHGVAIQGAPENLIGGVATGAGNVISGNADSGVFIGGTGASGNVLRGNLIGTNAAGSAAIANAFSGVTIFQAPGNTLEENVISGNGWDGVTIIRPEAIGNVLQSNFIGTNAAGNAALQNDVNGVFIFRAPNTTIGGTAPGAGNVIATNAAAGVVVAGDEAVDDAILGNSISENGDLGIDLGGTIDPGGDGVTSNDSGDLDIGPNEFQNFPAITVAAAGSTVVEGTLNSVANTSFRLEFFGSSVCDASGHGEGGTFLGFANVTTNANGDASFSETLAATATVGGQLTATATRLDAGVPTDTSEFSQCVTVAPPPPQPKCPGLEDVVGNHIVGTSGPDLLIGTQEADVICGLGGNDTIRGLRGNDLLDGGSGRDTLVGGAGADTLLGKGGNDVLKGKNGKDTAKGGGGKDSIRGGGGRDVLRGQAKDDDLRGQRGNDRLIGNAGDDSLNGGPGKADLCRQGPGFGPVKNCEL